MTSPSAPPRVLTGSILFLLAGLAAMGSLATNVILPVFPSMGVSLGVEPRDLGLTLSSFFIAFAVGQLFVGPLADRFGRKPLVVGGLITFVLGSAVCALSQSLDMLILGRVVQALGACAASVLARAIARDLFDGEALARVLALIMIAMAAAPGFSPLVGTGLGALLGWRFIFAGVGLFAVALGFFYLHSMGETQPSDARQPLRLRTVVLAYAALAADRRFILPALSVSLTIGMLFTFFATAPAILISELGLTGLHLALYFAATVFIVFGAGFLAPRLARRCGTPWAAMIGAVVALLGSLVIMALAAAPSLLSITAGLGLFLLGMGVLNPLGTAITLQPFANNAGLASALLGFLQMTCAALGSTAASVLPLSPTAALAATMSVGSALALLVFIPVILRLAHTKVALS